MRILRDSAAVARLDLADVRRSRWLVFCAALYAVMAALFVAVAMRESSILGFTGMSRVLISFCHALLLVLPLLALTATGQVIGQARESGALELLLAHPFSREGYYLGTTAVRFGVLLTPFVLLMLGAAGYARWVLGERLPWSFVLHTIGLSATLLWAFTGIGLLLSTLVRSQARVLTYLLLVYAAAVALLDFALIGLMLRWRLPPEGVFVLAALNPVETARMALLSGAEPELAILGPVGFYLANRIGPDALFALGIVWPLVVGTAAWLIGFRSFRRGDLV